MHPKAHDTLWTVHYIKTGAVLRFKGEEAARIRAMEDGDATPISIIPPRYYNA